MLTNDTEAHRTTDERNKNYDTHPKRGEEEFEPLVLKRIEKMK